MTRRRSVSTTPTVALLAEGVDRNIVYSITAPYASTVALLAEGVDRNLNTIIEAWPTIGRPPRGGRG